MRTLIYAPEKSSWHYAWKILAGSLLIAIVAAALLLGLLAIGMMAEDFTWLAICGSILVTVLTITAAVRLGIRLEKSKHVYWVDETGRIFRLDTNMRFRMDAASCRYNGMGRMVKEFHQWVSRMDRVPEEAPEIVAVKKISQRAKGWKIQCIQEIRGRRRRYGFFLGADWIRANSLVSALSNLDRQ